MAEPAAFNFLSLARRLMITAQVFGSMLHAAAIASMWGNRTAIAILVAAWIVAAVGNVVISHVMARRLTRQRRRAYVLGEHLRAAFNVAVHGAIGIVCHWNFASWLFVPFVTSLTNAPLAGSAWRRIAAMLLALDVIAMLTGARWIDALAFTGISVFVQFVIEAYLAASNNLLGELDRMFQELQTAQQAALAQDKLASVGQLAAGIAHEINNPMCFITANTEALLADLRDEPGLSPRIAEYRDAIVGETLDGVRRVNSIVGDLRRFARREPEQPIAFDLTAEVLAAVRMARTQRKPNQHLHADIAATLPIHGMPRQISQAILNLIMNGLEALSDQAGDVWVTTAEHPNEVVVSVRDGGAGMSSATLKNLFQPFFTTKPVGKGIGLGLAVVHGIVEAHHGRVEVESAPGHGSCFKVILPRPPARPGEDRTPERSDSELGGYRAGAPIPRTTEAERR